MTHALAMRASGGGGRDGARVQAIEAAFAIIGERGLAGLSMRDLAQAIGKSTTVIVNLFQTKAGLLGAVAQAAMAADTAFHEGFFAETAGVPLDHVTLRGVAARYVTLRAGRQAPFARVWQEFVTDAEASAAAREELRAWAQMRADAWTGLLARAENLAGLAPVFVQYLVMEEFYAGALAERLDYDLLLRETLEGLIARAQGAAPLPTPVLDWVVEGLTPPQPPGKRFEPGSMPMRLLDIAADLIMAGGVGAVSNRAVTQAAGASVSTILYHFGDMRSFLAQAIWHSVFRQIPAYLDWRSPLEQARPQDLDAWARLMAPTLALAPPSGASGEAGFYVKYARLIAQICLLARRDPAFQDLALLLRGPEGGGTYARRQAVWPPQFEPSRQSAAHFAIWIKGRALMDAALEPAGARPQERLREAALALVGQA